MIGNLKNMANDKQSWKRPLNFIRFPSFHVTDRMFDLLMPSNGNVTLVQRTPNHYIKSSLTTSTVAMPRKILANYARAECYARIITTKCLKMDDPTTALSPLLG